MSALYTILMYCAIGNVQIKILLFVYSTLYWTPHKIYY